MAATKPNNHSLLFANGSTVSKVIEPSAHFTIDEATAWSRRLLNYHHYLNDFGVPVSEHYRVEVQINEDKTTVIEYCDYGGVDLQALLTEGKISPREALGHILGGIEGILSQSPPKVGIDPHPANWCLKFTSDQQPVLSFVDFFPVYFVEEKAALVGFPQPTRGDELDMNYRRYYTPLGLIRLIRFNFVRVCGLDVEEIVNQAIADYVDPAFSINARFKELDVEKVRQDPRSTRTLVPEFNLDNVDDLREVAMIVASSSGQSDILDKVLRLTTADFRLPRSLREENFEKAKALLLAAVP